jgi:hypothetical protein
MSGAGDKEEVAWRGGTLEVCLRFGVLIRLLACRIVSDLPGEVRPGHSP